MKKLMALALLVTSISTFSASVRVTSFDFVSHGPSRNPLAEICGVVEGATSAPTFVNVMIDYRSNKPASYNTVVGSNGKFCFAVITYQGTALVGLINEEASVHASIK